MKKYKVGTVGIRYVPGPGPRYQGDSTYSSGVWEVIADGRKVAGFFDSPTGYPREGGSGRGAAINRALWLMGFRKSSDKEMRELLKLVPRGWVPSEFANVGPTESTDLRRNPISIEEADKQISAALRAYHRAVDAAGAKAVAGKISWDEVDRVRERENLRFMAARKAAAIAAGRPDLHVDEPARRRKRKNPRSNPKQSIRWTTKKISGKTVVHGQYGTHDWAIPPISIKRSFSDEFDVRVFDDENGVSDFIASWHNLAAAKKFAQAGVDSGCNTIKSWKSFRRSYP